MALSRIETLLDALVNGETVDIVPQSRNEAYLLALVEKMNLGGASAVDIQNAVNAYLEKNPVEVDLSGKQDTLKSGENIKTVNGETLLGSGDLEIKGGGATVTYDEEQDAIIVNNNGSASSGGSSKWTYLDTFDFSTGALSYTVDTNDFNELLIVVSKQLSTMPTSVNWKKCNMTNHLTMKLVGHTALLRYLPNGYVNILGGRGSGDTLPKTALVSVDESNTYDENSLVISFSYIPPDGEAMVYGR